MTATTPVDRAPRTGLLAIFLVGAAVSVGLGAYGRIHDPTGRRIFTVGFSAMPNMKIWLATIAFVLAVLQVLSARWIYGGLARLGEPPAWIKPFHRWSGTVAFVLTVPVAYHCLWSIGYGNRLADDSENLRRNLHSFFGCVFYGAFAAKMLALRAKRLPGWTLPVAGGLLFGALTLVWLTSSVWWFTQVDFPAF